MTELIYGPSSIAINIISCNLKTVWGRYYSSHITEGQTEAHSLSDFSTVISMTGCKIRFPDSKPRACASDCRADGASGGSTWSPQQDFKPLETDIIIISLQILKTLGCFSASYFIIDAIMRQVRNSQDVCLRFWVSIWRPHFSARSNRYFPVVTILSSYMLIHLSLGFEKPNSSYCPVIFFAGTALTFLPRKITQPVNDSQTSTK